MDDVETFASHINQKWEKLDGLVNNAGGALLTKSPSAFLERNDKNIALSSLETILVLFI